MVDSQETQHFQALCQNLRKLPIEELRFQEKDYLEFVVVAATLSSLHAVLKNYFGPALDFQKKDAKNAVAFIEQWGGIRPDQSLYYREQGKFTEFAMIWPWAGGERASIRVGQVKESLF